MFQFGYSYDLTTTNLRNYSSGTHEVMLALTFGKAPVERAAQQAAQATGSQQ
jgi:hypothetical protein